jgi:hypothetical protein
MANDQNWEVERVWGPKSSAPVVFLRDFEMMLTSSAKNKK